MNLGYRAFGISLSNAINGCPHLRTEGKACPRDELGEATGDAFMSRYDWKQGILDDNAHM